MHGECRAECSLHFGDTFGALARYIRDITLGIRCLQLQVDSLRVHSCNLPIFNADYRKAWVK